MVPSDRYRRAIGDLLKPCRGCAVAKELDQFPEPGAFESGVELTGGMCWSCVQAFISEWGLLGFDPHGRPSGLTDIRPRITL